MLMKTPFRTQLQNSVFLIVFPLCYILIGALFQFVPDINPRVVAIVLATCVIVSGTVMIARYFLQGSFRDLYSYEFSFGAFAVIAGVCMMIAASKIGDLLLVLLGVCMLMTSIIKVQNAIQLIGMKRRTWIPVLIIAVLLIAADVLVIINPFADKQDFYRLYTNILLMTDGVLSFVINVLMHIRARKAERALAVVPADGAPVPVDGFAETGVDKQARAEKSDRAADGDKAEKDSGKNAERSKDKTAGKPAEQPAKKQADKSADKSAEKSTEKPAEKPVEKTDGNPGKSVPEAGKNENAPASDDRIKELFGKK